MLLAILDLWRSRDEGGGLDKDSNRGKGFHGIILLINILALDMCNQRESSGRNVRDGVNLRLWLATW
jgi:hypothetical protein